MKLGIPANMFLKCLTLDTVGGPMSLLLRTKNGGSFDPEAEDLCPMHLSSNLRASW